MPKSRSVHHATSGRRAAARTVTRTTATKHEPTHIAHAHDTDPTITLETPTGSLEQFERYLPMARDIAPGDVRMARINVSVAILNATEGVAVVLAHRDELARIPGISIDKIEELAAMGDALAYAVASAERYAPSKGDTREALVTARALRTKLLQRADVLVADGVFSAAAVAAIRKGRGPIDTAGDCVTLAALFHKHAGALAQSVVVSPADLQAADRIGRKLMATLRPVTMPKKASAEQAATAEDRDRMWTLFEDTWEQNVWLAGAHLFLRAGATHVPLLLSSTRTRRAAKPPVQPAPEPVPITPSPAPAQLTG